MSNTEVALQYEVLGGSGQCLVFSDVPVTDPVQIAVVADPPAAALAQSLFQALARALTPLSLSPAASTACGQPRLLACRGRSVAETRSLLIVVTGTGPISRSLADLMRDWTQGRPQNSRVWPLVPQGGQITQILPAGLNLYQAASYGPLLHFVPDILALAGVGGDEFRLFLSYRRDDASALADQLFDAFSRRQFRVYLDRFRGRPGRKFPEELAEELVDKGLVVVLESPRINQSPWTLAEVAFARLYRLGLLAVEIPGAMRLAMIPPASRYVASLSAWRQLATPPNQWVLSSAGCDQCVEFVRQQYALQTLRRRCYQEGRLRGALAAVGLGVQPAVAGTFEVTGAQRGYTVHLSQRSPTLGDARRLVRAAPHGSDRVWLGPTNVGPPERRVELEWLAAEMSLALRDEFPLAKTARDMSQGRNLP